MKQQRILKYFINSIVLVLLCCASINAQNDSINVAQMDSIKFTQKYGIRIGGDLSKIVRSFMDDDYQGFEINADYRLTKKWFIAGELGTEEKTSSTDYLNVTSKGNYFKVGGDYNFYKNWFGMENMMYSGLRVGFGSFSQTLNSFNVYNTNQYWQPHFSSTSAQEFNGLTAVWAELILGLKAEVLNNLYVGANIQFKGILSEKQPENFENLYIPGFNKTYDSGRFGVGFGYNISYLIPLYKKGN
jgi:hypothetical protein